ncbi:hypothetical protein [Embleya scabrispora]|uniref:hypothetical protein n=1 Tax=Embleya scabrispora TaxID=159449 RepID=UPI0003727EB2|nr:hypothetical protein [Embleya scabrispora]MYS80489.1 hypothetical protein [Streptomyces sp. SID5474]
MSHSIASLEPAGHSLAPRHPGAGGDAEVGGEFGGRRSRGGSVLGVVVHRLRVEDDDEDYGEIPRPGEGFHHALAAAGIVSG